MDLKVLGSGATHPIPKPCCSCEVCENARKEMRPPEMRTGPSLYIEDISALIDTSQDISMQLNRERIDEVKRIFYTHYHPDHTMGMMIINQIAGSYENDDGALDIYFPEGVLEDLTKYNLSGMIEYYSERGLANLHEYFESDNFADIEIKAVPLAEPNTHGFTLEDDRKIFYAPCDITDYNLKKVSDHDIFILEFGGINMSKFQNPEEITDFYRVFEQLKDIKPEKVIFTHIEENRRMAHGEIENLARELEKEAEFSIEIAFDGMEI